MLVSPSPHTTVRRFLEVHGPSMALTSRDIYGVFFELLTDESGQPLHTEPIPRVSVFVCTAPSSPSHSRQIEDAERDIVAVRVGQSSTISLCLSLSLSLSHTHTLPTHTRDSLLAT